MKPYETWLKKAKNDLVSSKKLIKGDDSVLDTSIYHTQQCAEKALKGFLSFKQYPLEKTHDIDYLIECCMECDIEFETILDYGDILNPYSTLFRYPGPVLDPEIEDVREAIKMAEKIFNFVKKKIEAEEKAQLHDSETAPEVKPNGQK